MKRTAILAGFFFPLVFLAAKPVGASVVSLHPDLVAPLDTFGLALYGYDSSNNGVYVENPFVATFGLTQTFSVTGAGGAQTVTVSSSSTSNSGMTTDTITVTVPSNFAPDGTVTAAGNAVTSLELDLGGFHAGTNTIDFLAPVNSPTFAGAVSYRTNSTFIFSSSDLAANSIFTNNNSSLATAEAVESGTNPVSQYAVHGFAFSITYADVVPEPPPGVFASAGALIVGALCWRRQCRRCGSHRFTS